MRDLYSRCEAKSEENWCMLHVCTTSCYGSGFHAVENRLQNLNCSSPCNANKKHGGAEECRFKRDFLSFGCCVTYEYGCERALLGNLPNDSGPLALQPCYSLRASGDTLDVSIPSCIWTSQWEIAPLIWPN
jgi:hypothetical protein